MPISVTCDKCQTVISASASKAGQRAKCPRCGDLVQIPAAGSPGPATAPKASGIPQPAAAKRKTSPAPQPAEPILAEIDLSLPLGTDLNAPLANLGKPASNWSGKKRHWKDAPTWVWFARGGVAVVLLLLFAQAVLYGIKLGRKFDATPPEVTQDPTQPPIVDGSRLPPAEDKKPPQSSGNPSRPLVGSQPASPSTSQTTVANAPSSSSAGNKTLLDIMNAVGDGVVQITVVDTLGRESEAGVGFVIDPSGLVATNFHVVAKARSAQAKFRRQRIYEIVGYRAYDEARDLAIVQLAGVGPGMTALKLQTIEWPKPGSEVLAVGNASTASEAFTSGVVSNVQTTAELPTGARHFLRSPDDDTWIQATAVVAGGKTGGPLLNKLGEVIGVNTWSSESQKLTFALHVRHLKNLYDQLKSDIVAFEMVNGAAGKKDRYRERGPQVITLLNEFQQAYDSFNESLKTQTRTGQSPHQIAQFVALKNPIPVFTEKLFLLSDENRKQPLALEALTGVCELLQLPGAYSAPTFVRASSRILEDHLDDPKLGAMLFDIARLSNPDTLNWLRQVAQKTKEPQVAGPACCLLAGALHKIEPSKADREREIVALLQRAERDYADVPMRETTVGKAAGALLFEVQHLSIGKQAPEIVGHDISGKELRLDDFAGKVLVIDFFADWSPKCTSMYHHEHNLLVQFKDKPFALVGVNLDAKARFQNVLRSGQITWPCWWDGPEGPIAARWNVQTVPTMFVLDRKGIIRHKFHGVLPTVLIESVEKLLPGDKYVLPDELQPATDGDLQAGLDKLAAVAGTQPYPAVVNAAILLIQAQRGKTTKSHLELIESWIRKGLELEPASLSLQLAHNRLLQFQGNVAEAAGQLRDLLKRDDLSRQDVVLLQCELAHLLVTQSERPDKEANEGMTLIEAAISAGSPTPEMFDTRAMAYLARNMLPQARTDLANAISNKPGPMPYFHLAMVEWTGSNTQAAKDALHRAIAEGLSPRQLTPLEQKQLRTLVKALGMPLPK